jgi:hypothetical protein
MFRSYTLGAGAASEAEAAAEETNTEDLNPCWCCAPSAERCSPTNQSGNGRIVLAQCFRSRLLR